MSKSLCCTGSRWLFPIEVIDEFEMDGGGAVCDAVKAVYVAVKEAKVNSKSLSSTAFLICIIKMAK